MYRSVHLERWSGSPFDGNSAVDTRVIIVAMATSYEMHHRRYCSSDHHELDAAFTAMALLMLVCRRGLSRVRLVAITHLAM